jgi:hypothetical protein
MSLFASAGKSNKQLGVRIKQVRSVLEHIGLYVGLAVYTAAGAKVKRLQRDVTVDKITIKTPTPICRLYWCFVEFIEWRYCHSCFSTPLAPL